MVARATWVDTVCYFCFLSFATFHIAQTPVVKWQWQTQLASIPSKVASNRQPPPVWYTAHHSLEELSCKYGPLMLLHLGHVPTFVVSSAKMAREMMKTHDVVFSNRPKTTAVNIFTYEYLEMSFAPYGNYWRHARKVTILELLSLKRVQSFQFVREELKLHVNQIHHACVSKSPINLIDMLFAVSNNITSRCVFGRRFEVKNC